MIKDLINSDFKEILEKGVSFLKEYEYFRVLTHYDGDGTSAAIILTTMLQRMGKKFHLGFIKELSPEGFSKRIMEEPNLPVIVADAGSDQVKFVKERVSDILVLDHHYYSGETENCININARDYGIDGTRDACGATMAFIFSLFVDENNSDLLPFMLSGAIADKQDIGGFRGINKELIEHYGKEVEKRHILNLDGENLEDALVYSIDPFFKNLSGSTDYVKKLLKSLSIDGSVKPEALDSQSTVKLTKYLAYTLVNQGCQSEAISYLERDEFFFKNGFSASYLSKIIDANAKNGDNNLPVEYFLGNTFLRDEMILNKRNYETRLIDYITRSYKAVEEEKNVQFFYAPGSEMAGAISGELMLYLVNQHKPIVGFNVGETTTLISMRGNRRMVERGLNLSKVSKECTSKLGGSGGGHDIAAGGSIPRGMERQFIELADEMIGIQLKNIEMF
jgi:RecJ-like exonuclease